MVVVVHPPGASRGRGQIRTRPPPRAPGFPRFTSRDLAVPTRTNKPFEPKNLPID